MSTKTRVKAPAKPMIIPSHCNHLYSFKRIRLQGRIQPAERNRIRKISNPRFFLTKVIAPPLIITSAYLEPKTFTNVSLGKCRRSSLPIYNSPSPTQNPSPLKPPPIPQSPNSWTCSPQTHETLSLEKCEKENVFDLKSKQDNSQTQYFSNQLTHQDIHSRNS